MAKKRTEFVCTNCGNVTSSWAGRCLACGEWSTLEEQIVPEAAATVLGGKQAPSGTNLKGASVRSLAKKQDARFSTSLDDVDEVLGGGIVIGSVCLIAGQPGIGKSTLLLQLASQIGANHDTLYISGEESGHQIGLRAQRLGVSSAHLSLATTTDTDDIVATIASGQHKLVIVDSIQTIGTKLISSSSSGSIAQITNSTRLIVQAAKQSNTAVLIVGHVTKEGSIAGPKLLEHLVDVVLQLEGDSYGGFKILRAAKNRFGPTSEAAILEMQASGLKPVENPSAALLAERQITDGSVVFATLEGTRPLLVEVQALVNKTSYGYPKRAASGIDLNRVNLLVAVLERRTKLNLSEQDIYINVVGGIRLQDPAADLAVCMAIGSAAKGLKLKQNAVVFGEVGLSGEVRRVPFIEKRLAEAKKMGFDTGVGPKTDATSKLPLPLVNCPDVRTALNQFLES
ncbi:MAG: DNA repair protein RadA [Candidatus Saccharimonadales bacterium]